MNRHYVYQTGFGDNSFGIECNCQETYELAEFLFLDFPGASSTHCNKTYHLLSEGQEPHFILRDGGRSLYSGESKYQLAYLLMNEVIYHCINQNNHQHALHAGAVTYGDRCFILPGKSGNGKSTLTCWLITNGFNYLTDELVFLGSDGEVTPVTRPISLKVGTMHNSWLLSEKKCNEVLTSDNGSMVPHRLLNPDFKARKNHVTDILFPQYNPAAEPRLCEISTAQSCLHLLASHVNARNLPGHGISELASITRGCRSFTLSYRCFDDLEHIFNSSLWRL